MQSPHFLNKIFAFPYQLLADNTRSLLFILLSSRKGLQSQINMELKVKKNQFKFFKTVALYILCILAAEVNQSYAQSPEYTISFMGLVIDSTTEEPIEGVSIALFTEDEVHLVTGTITNRDGSFLFEELVVQNYWVRISYVGYKTKTIELNELDTSTTYNQGEIHLDQSKEQMDEVAVTAQRDAVTFERDRTTYRADQMVSSTGVSVIELLDEIASIEVDVQGNISYRGNQNIVIHVNGRPISLTGDALTSYLRSIPSDFIEQVETIPNPSARHDPEGIGGIINIVLKDDRELGLSGRVAANVSTLGRFQPNISGGYHRDPLNIFASYSFGIGNYEFQNIEQREQFGSDAHQLDRELDTNFDTMNHMFNLNSDYSLGNSTTILSNNQIGVFGNDQKTFSINRFANPSLNNPNYDIASLYDRTGTFLNNSLIFERQLNGSDQVLSIEGAHEYLGYGYDSTLRQTFFVDELESSESFRDLDGFWREFKANVDYEDMLWEKLNLETGLESRIKTDSRELSIGSVNSDFTYNLITHSAYSIFGLNIGSFDLEGGFRVEQAYTELDDITNSDVEVFENDYFNIFPSGSIGYSLKQDKQVSLSYSKRINRPSLGALITNMDTDDPLFRNIGNPELEPELTHSYELAYFQFGQGYTFSIQPYFRRTTNVIRREVDINHEGVTSYTMRNLDSQNNYGAELTTSFSVDQNIRINSSANLYRTEIDGSNVDSNLESGAFAWSLNLNKSYSFSFGLMVQIMGNYRSPIDVEYGEVGSQKSINLSLRHQFLSDRLQVSAQFTDLFDTRGSSFDYQTEHFRHVRHSEMSSRGFNLSISYSFGERELPQADTQPPMQ